MLALTPAVMSAGIYKWEQDGTVHYGERPPPDVDAVLMNPRTGADTERAQEQLEEQREQLETMDRARELRAEREAEQAAEADAKRQNCENARTNLSEAQARTRLLMEQDDGELAMMTEEQRQEQIRKAQEMVDKYCN